MHYGGYLPAVVDISDDLLWNEVLVFEERDYEDIRNIVRRDRNHSSIWMWEPMLNETWFPESFAKNVLNIVGEEYLFFYSYFTREWGDNPDDWSSHNSPRRVSRTWGDLC